jgi:hypothetical protein
VIEEPLNMESAVVRFNDVGANLADSTESANGTTSDGETFLHKNALQEENFLRVRFYDIRFQSESIEGIYRKEIQPERSRWAR